MTSLTTGPEQSQVAATGMIAGAVGLVAYCIAATFLVKRFGAVVGSLVAWIASAVLAAAVYWFLAP